MTEEQIAESVSKAREHMLEKLKNAPTLVNAKDTHQAALAKEKHMEKIRSALNISEKHEFGAAFDLELQENKRLERLAEREKIKKEKKKAKKEAKKQKEREEL
jgi:serine/arginine repetitive matrix protein 2